MLSCVLVWNPRQVGALSSQMMEPSLARKPLHAAWCLFQPVWRVPFSPSPMDAMGIPRSPFPFQVDQEP